MHQMSCNTSRKNLLADGAGADARQLPGSRKGRVVVPIRRIGEFAGDENLPAEPRDRLQNVVNRYARHLEAGARLEAWLEDADRHRQCYDSIYRRTHDLDFFVSCDAYSSGQILMQGTGSDPHPVLGTGRHGTRTG